MQAEERFYESGAGSGGITDGKTSATLLRRCAKFGVNAIAVLTLAWASGLPPPFSASFDRHACWHPCHIRNRSSS